MAYRMMTISERVRIGVTGTGDFNIEVWTPGRSHPDAALEEINLPGEDADEVAKFLLRNGS